MSTSTKPKNVPSLEEAHRVVSFVLDDELKALAAQVAEGTPTTETLRNMLALTIAVVGATEHLHGAVGRPQPAQWESIERSAEAFVDHFVVDWLAKDDPELRRAITKHRRRKLTARAGKLRLVESDRNKRARWAAVTLPPDAPLPIAVEVGKGLAELVQDVEERLYTHMNAMPSHDPLVLAGQIVGLLAAAECLLALYPSNRVAAFCVHLAAMSEAAAAQ